MAASGVPKEILIVDDDRDVRAFLELAMLREGYSIRTAATAADALKEARLKRPDVILLDLIMPEMSGEELCAILKKDPRLRKTIVFILSASADVRTKVRCFESGADEYLVKPVEPQEITARIERSFKLRRSAPAANRTAEPVDPDDTQNLENRARYGPYIIQNLIGAGGMGHVYKAIDPQLERHVAIKVLPRELCRSQEFVLRFRTEARLLASMNHPHIATVYNFGVEESDLYFAMQWCSGGSLSDLLNGGQPIQVDVALQYALQCAEALQAASQKRVVHRDVKPGNILFDDGRNIKLVDFGLAFSQKQPGDLSDVSEFLGTPLYMSPEQGRSHNIDHRSDIYSLGIVLFQMLAGRTPYSGGTALEIILKHATQPFPDYNELPAAVPYGVYEIIERMTQKSPEMRYRDYQDLIGDLQHSLKQYSGTRIEDLTEVSLKDLVEPEPDTISFLTGIDALLYLFHHRSSGALSVQLQQRETRLRVHDRKIFSDAGDHKTDDLMRLLTEAMQQQPQCSYAFHQHEEDEPAGSFLRIQDVLLESTRKWIDSALVHSSLRECRIVLRTGTFDRALTDFLLTPQESFIAYRIEGDSTTLESLRILTGLPDELILRTIFLLAKIGAVDLR